MVGEGAPRSRLSGTSGSIILTTFPIHEPGKIHSAPLHTETSDQKPDWTLLYSSKARHSPLHFPALGFRSVVGTLSLKPMHAWDVGFRQEVYTDPGILQTPTLLLGNSCSLLRVPAEDELREAAAAGSVLH